MCIRDRIYRGDYMINWCPRCHTALSDIEVEHEDKEATLTHIRYPLAGGGGYIVVATTRPESMLGDSGVAVHPEDQRYRDCLLYTSIIVPPEPQIAGALGAALLAWEDCCAAGTT